MYQQLDQSDFPALAGKPHFAAPRRLSMRVVNLSESPAPQKLEKWGPPVSIAFDANGNTTKAAGKFLQELGCRADDFPTRASLQHADITEKNDGKIDKLYYCALVQSGSVNLLLPAFVKVALHNLPIPKRMRWGSRKAEFVRPAHWVVMMYGNNIIDCEVLEQKSGNKTRGHRFHSPDLFEINSPADYQQQLRDHKVEVCFAQRRKKIVEQVNAAAQKLGAAVIDRNLLDEVNSLVEWPVALAGNFEKRFLDVPQEALISSMSEHQKYFHVVDADGKLMPHFITVANLESKDPKKVIEGNERVIRPRLSDAAFFFEVDKKQTLESRLEKLKAITFQEKLGSVYDKSIRVSELAEDVAKEIGANSDAAARAGLLCKADLVSKMVLEFDTMQGIAGQYYARNDKEPDSVAVAIREHYLPKNAGDEVPQSLEGCAVALADRIDTLVGIISIGEKPTGSKDPFALRRAAIGVLNIILKRNLEIELASLITNADALSYIMDRLRSIYEEEGIPAEIFNAVDAKKLSNPLDIQLRVHAVHQFSNLPEAAALAAANKRVANILSKSPASTGWTINADRFVEPEERALWNALQSKRESTSQLINIRNYTESLCSLAVLKEPIDAYFNKVMVNVDDPALRNNRLNALSDVRELFLGIADISYLVPEKK